MMGVFDLLNNLVFLLFNFAKIILIFSIVLSVGLPLLRGLFGLFGMRGSGYIAMMIIMMVICIWLPSQIDALTLKVYHSLMASASQFNVVTDMLNLDILNLFR